ncbi:MAG: glycosyltransferase family 2 protein, partial [Prevotella sp.]
MTKVSVLIAVYNTEKYLHECLDSLLHQTLEEWEAICVDDASTDGSWAILQDYAAKDDRF